MPPIEDRIGGGRVVARPWESLSRGFQDRLPRFSPRCRESIKRLIAEQAINAPNVDRLLVTMPHKRAVFGHCATSSERATLLVVVYYLAPLNRALDAGTWIEFVLGLVVFAVIIGYETRAIIASDVPHLRMIQAVATGLPTLLLVFAAIYVLIARNDPGSFSEMLSRTDALYFTLTVFATVGVGDIAPRSDVARILTMIQMIMDLVAVGVDRGDPDRRGRHRATAAQERDGGERRPQ